MTRLIAYGALALILAGMVACSGGHRDGGEQSKGPAAYRTEVRDTAAALLPQLAEQLGGTMGPATGRYHESGGDLSSLTFSYSAGAQIMVPGAGPHATAAEKALKDLGYTTDTTTTPSGDLSTISAQKDGLKIVVGERAATAAGQVTVSVSSPYVKAPKNKVKELQAKVAKEPLDVK